MNRPVNALFQAAKEIADFINMQGWSYCIIGGLAVMRWGEPRTTQDVDLTLLTELGGEETFVKTLLDHFTGRGQDPFNQALQNRVLLLTAANGVGIDVALAGFPFEEKILQRATEFEFAEGCRLTTCSAEDLVVSKAFADRPKDWLDVEGVLIRQGHKLDIPRILRLLTPLCELKEAPEIMARFRALVKDTR